MSGPELAVVGQVGRDLVLRVGALPAGGGVTEVLERQELLGGKGANQALAAVQLGLSAAVVSVVGDDPAGEIVLGQAWADRLDVRGVQVRPDATTALLVDVVEADGTRRLLEDVPDDVLLTAADVEAAAAVFTQVETVLIQLRQPPEAVLAAQRLADRIGALVVMDGVPADPSAREEVLSGADVLRADAAETRLLAGGPVETEQDALAVARERLRGRTRVVALAAESGNAVAWPEGAVVVPPLGDGPVRDRTGAGDAFVAALAAGLTHRGDAETAAWQAGAAAAYAVRKPGGRPELDRFAVDRLARRARH